MPRLGWQICRVLPDSWIGHDTKELVNTRPRNSPCLCALSQGPHRRIGLLVGGRFLTGRVGTEILHSSVHFPAGSTPETIATLPPLTTVAIFGLTFIDSTAVFVGGVWFLGFVLFDVRPTIQSWMMQVASAQMRGSATSLLFGAQSLFSMAMSLIGGLIADNYGLSKVFYAIAAAMLLSNVTIFMLPSEERASTTAGSA